MSTRTFKSLSEFFIILNLESHKSYLNKIPSYLEFEKEKLEAELKESVKYMTSDEADLYYQYNYEEQMHFFDNYKQTFYESLYISLYSFLEKELLKICRKLESENTHKIKVKHLTGNGIEKHSLFLSTLYDLEISQFTTWNEIKNHQKIRNYLVHNDGTYINVQNPIYQPAISLGCISRITRGQRELFEIKILDNTCSRLINCIEGFFEELFNKASSLGVNI